MLQSSRESSESPFVSTRGSGPGVSVWREGVPSPVAGLFAWLWRPLKWFWLTLILSWLAASFVIVLAQADQPGAPELPVTRLALAQPWVIAALGLLGLLTPGAFLARRARRAGSLSVPRRVEALAGRAADFIPRYVRAFYLYRVADAEAREALRAAASRASDEGAFGVCVLGPTMIGKTRLAWEAMQAELADWTLVRWPCEGGPGFDVAALGGGRVVVWLDDLAKYAHLGLAPALNDLPRRLREVGARFVVVATCRDGEEALRAAGHLSALMEHLVAVRPAEIGENEIDWHAAALKYHGIRVRTDQFDGTPGSVALEPLRMAREGYPALPKSAQRVLRALKLLRSAGMYWYPERRVRATVEDVFGLERFEWRRARHALARAGFIRLEPGPSGRGYVLAPVADVYVEEAAPDATPPGRDMSDGWRELEKSLTRRGDAEALSRLGLAFLERRVGSASVNRQHAEACFRAALAGYRQAGAHAAWAIAQGHLGLTHWQQAQTAQALERGVLLAQAEAAYRLALRVGQWEDIPLYAALMQEHLGATLNEEARLTDGAERAGLHAQAVEALRDARRLYGRSLMREAEARVQEDVGAALSEQAHLMEGAGRAGLLREAVTAFRAAQEVYERAGLRASWARARNNLGVALMQQAELEDGEARGALLEEARAAHEAALEVYTPAGTPEGWASAQGNLGNVLRHEAELCAGEEREALLALAVGAYRAALRVATREDTPEAWAMMQNNLGNALSDQAELEAGGGRMALLREAASAHHAALLVYTRGYVPVEWAGTHLNLAQVYFARALAMRGTHKVKRQTLARAQDAALEALAVFSADTAPEYHAAALRLYDEIEAALEALGSPPGVYASA